MYTAPRTSAWQGLLALALVVLPLCGAAAATPGDPLEKLNRATYAFNDALDRMLARPAARAYVAVVPAALRKSVSNFTANLSYPEVIFNDALQGKFNDAASDMARLVLNTTIGIGGFLDPATRLGFQSHDEDFGQTLGHWGVPPGPYLMIPVLGPSDFRDAPGKLIDSYASPAKYVKSSKARYGLYLLRPFNTRVELLAADTALRNAYDPYVFVRNAYVARRNYLVHDGNVAEDNFDDPIGDASADRPAGAPAANEPVPATTSDTGAPAGPLHADAKEAQAVKAGAIAPEAAHSDPAAERPVAAPADTPVAPAPTEP